MPTFKTRQSCKIRMGLRGATQDCSRGQLVLKRAAHQWTVPRHTSSRTGGVNNTSSMYRVTKKPTRSAHWSRPRTSTGSSKSRPVRRVVRGMITGDAVCCKGKQVRAVPPCSHRDRLAHCGWEGRLCRHCGLIARQQRKVRHARAVLPCGTPDTTHTRRGAKTTMLCAPHSTPQAVACSS